MIPKKKLLQFAEYSIPFMLSMVPFIFSDPNSFALLVSNIGVNMLTPHISSGIKLLKENFLNSKYGLLNHDLQKAFIKATKNAFHGTIYNYIQNLENEREKNQLIKFSNEIDEVITEMFPLDIFKKEELQNFLYNPNRGQEEFNRKLISLIEEGHLTNEFKTYLLANLLKNVIKLFYEELKNDNKDSNKAWRAFQILLNESLLEHVKSIDLNQTENLKILKEIEILLLNKSNKTSKIPSSLKVNELYRDTLYTIINKIDDIIFISTDTNKKVSEIHREIYKSKLIRKIRYKKNLKLFIIGLVVIVLIIGSLPILDNKNKYDTQKQIQAYWDLLNYKDYITKLIKEEKVKYSEECKLSKDTLITYNPDSYEDPTSDIWFSLDEDKYKKLLDNTLLVNKITKGIFSSQVDRCLDDFLICVRYRPQNSNTPSTLLQIEFHQDGITLLRDKHIINKKIIREFTNVLDHLNILMQKDMDENGQISNKYSFYTYLWHMLIEKYSSIPDEIVIDLKKLRYGIDISMTQDKELLIDLAKKDRIFVAILIVDINRSKLLSVINGIRNSECLYKFKLDKKLIAKKNGIIVVAYNKDLVEPNGSKLSPFGLQNINDQITGYSFTIQGMNLKKCEENWFSTF
jgi:hypothetical protein